MAAELGRGELSLERVAERLSMSPRTLRRQLQHQGTHYRGLLDEVRRELTERYLDQRKLSLGEVAARLGFADASAFSKAFRRWTGKSPRAHFEHTPSAGPAWPVRTEVRPRRTSFSE